MKTFKNSELKTFEQLASLRQSSLKNVLASFLKKHYSKVVHTNEYIIAEGDIPVALTAHMDTVFKFPPDEIYFDSRKNVLWSPDGLGADDRAGVFALTQYMNIGKVAVTNNNTVTHPSHEGACVSICAVYICI